MVAPPITSLAERTNKSPDALTTQEIDVLREVANGNTNAEIAGRRYISEATVRTYLIHI